MNIGIDGRALEGNLTGTGRYIAELCRQLDILLPAATFYLYSRKTVTLPFVSSRWVYRVEPNPIFAKLKSVLWLKLAAGRLCSKDDLDFYWATVSFVPNLKKDVKIITTIHDFVYLLYPSTMSLYTYIAHKLFFKKDVLRAKCITVNSEGTRDKLKSLFSLNARYIVRPGVSLDFKRNHTENLEGRYGFKKPYILAVATLEPRKNLLFLLKSFIKLKREGFLEGYSLVLAGGRGWKDQNLQEVLSRVDINDSIYPIGYVNERDLPNLYREAELFVFPSVYEGFGMPILEARACGAKVLASNIPEHKEAGGKLINYFELGDENNLSEAILLNIGKNQPLDRADSDLSVLYKEYSWAASAQILVSAITEC